VSVKHTDQRPPSPLSQEEEEQKALPHLAASKCHYCRCSTASYYCVCTPSPGMQINFPFYFHADRSSRSIFLHPDDFMCYPYKIFVQVAEPGLFLEPGRDST
jgi:hypothetical protein